MRNFKITVAAIATALLATTTIAATTAAEAGPKNGAKDHSWCC